MKRILLLLLFFCFQFVFSSINDSIYNGFIIEKNIKTLPIEIKSEFNEEYLKNNFPVNSLVNDSLAKAKEVMRKLEETQNYVETLDKANLVSLPVGVKKEVGTLTTVMGVSSAKFYPEYTEVTVFIKLTLPQSSSDGTQKELFFGANNLKISHKGGIYGDTNIGLMGDIPIPIDGGNALLLLKGGFDMQTGAVDNKTYVTIDCSGFKELGVSADVMFSRAVMEPVDSNYKVIQDPSKKVTGHFDTVASDWNDILAEISLPPFQLTKENSTDGTGKAGLIFELNTAVFDFSDKRNSPNVVFPQEYNSYLVPGNHELWRGVYVKSLSVVLPKQFKKRNKQDRVSFNASDLLIDGMGVSGTFSIEKDLIPLNEGDASGWQFSVDYLQATIVTNSLTEAGFGGNVVLPVSKEVSSDEVKNLPEDELAKKAIKYTAIINPENDEYTLSLEPLKELKFNVFKAEAKLTSNSRVELKVKEQSFRPKAILHGNLNINASNKDVGEGKEGIVNFKGIEFEKLQLQTESPYFTVDYMGYKGEVKFARFPVTISEIGVTANDQKVALRFALDVNLMGKGFSGGTKLEIAGKFDETDGLQRWKFDKVDIEQINVEADLGSVKFKGLVDIKDDDPIYGDGFYGELEADFNSINVKATAWFGKTEVRYWYVDAYADLSAMATKPTIGPVLVNGFGGGAYYHMEKKSNPTMKVYEGKPIKTPKPPSGMDYVPDPDSGLGFRAMLGFELATASAFNGKIGFEMAFNTSGGLNRVCFFGEAHIMKTIDFRFGDKFKEKLTKMQEKISTLENNATIQKLKETNLVEYSKSAFPQDGLTFDVGIDANFSMEMDFKNHSFHSEMEVYLNTPGNFISGVGARGRAGWAVFHTDRESWYLHMGTPKDRIGLRVGIGSFSLKATTYLMIGDKIPGSPPPPQAVADILGVQLDQLDYMRDLNALGDGRGFAFGMDFSMDTGNMNFLIFYARFRAGIGFDIMVKDYGETACKGSGQIGIDGWYANGQAYAYLEGELGINIRLWFIKKKIPIIKAGAAVLLQAKLPNPAWFRGYVGGHFSVLGGLVSGSFRFKIELGDECEIIGGAPLGGLKIISGVTPENESSDVDVFTTPQAAFNMKINKPFKLEDDAGVKTYKILLDEFTVKKDGNDIEGELEWNTQNDVANYVSFDVLPPQSTIKVKVVVSFQELRNGSWVTIMDGNKKAQEIEERVFTTGEAPDYIPLTNVIYSYPVVDQTYFYQKERTTGYLKLKRGQPYLFTPETNWVQKVKYTSDVVSAFNNVSYDRSDRQVNFNFSKLSKETQYKLTIVSSPPSQNNNENAETYTEQNTGQEGNTVKVRNKNVQNVINDDNETEIITYNFTTSKYNTFADKIEERNIVQHYLNPIYSDVHAIETDTEADEKFDKIELEGDKYTANEAMIQVEAILDDSYYEDRIFNLVYKGYPLEPEFTVDRNTSLLGIPPKKGVDLMTWYVTELNARPNYSLLSTRIPYRYNLPYYYKHDFIDIQYKVVNKYLNDPEQYATQIANYDYIINGVFPAIRSGRYKVKMQYVLPGNILGSSTEFKYKNPF